MYELCIDEIICSSQNKKQAINQVNLLEQHYICHILDSFHVSTMF
jgi:hypothetical protein